MKTLISAVAYGGLDFTKLLIRGIRETVMMPHELLIIVAKPGDGETAIWCSQEQIPHITHNTNKGFPASLNDIYDYAWMVNDFDNVIIAGNDVIPYPCAIDSMIETAISTDFEWIAASQFNVQTLVAMYPDTAKYFSGETFQFTDFNARPWDAHAVAVAQTPRQIDANPQGPSLIKDVQNLCLYKGSVFDKIGYFDVSFWPNGYFSDCDYARRGVNANVKSCALNHAQYFHSWSRTIHQGEARPNDHYFRNNEARYIAKWGGPFGAETLTPEVKIFGRDHEAAIIAHWSNL